MFLQINSSNIIKILINTFFIEYIFKCNLFL